MVVLGVLRPQDVDGRIRLIVPALPFTPVSFRVPVLRFLYSSISRKRYLLIAMAPIVAIPPALFHSRADSTRVTRNVLVVF